MVYVNITTVSYLVGMAELADAHDSKSCGKPCGFDSHWWHQKDLIQTDKVFFIYI